MQKNALWRGNHRRIELGAVSRETKAMTFGADDSKAGLWISAGLKAD